jgi:PKD repeat protein
MDGFISLSEIFYMKQLSLKRLGSKLALLTMLAVPGLANAQLFNYNQYGDVLAGFRQTTPAGNYELVVDLGSVTNFLNLTVGTTINITNYSTSQMTNAFTSFGKLQWSAFASFPGSISSWVTPLGSFPKDTLWYTQPAPNATTQSQVPYRDNYNVQSTTKNLITSVGNGALSIANYLAVTNANSNALLVREPVTYSTYILTAFIGDSINPAIGDFGDYGAGGSGSPLPYSVENTNPASFTAPTRDDFYQLCPTTLTDPITSSTTNTYYLGYFLMYPDGSMTFTRAASVVTPPPAAGFSGSPTTGFAPLPVVFTDASTGSITNWLWSFGDGQSVTNTSNASVNHTYAAGGSYTVTLTVSGAGGANADAQTSYIVVSSTPTISTVTKSGGNLVMGGTGNPAGTQYRILTSTNLASPLASWTPVTTNAFLSNGSYSYTNSTDQKAAFFRLVSP